MLVLNGSASVSSYQEALSRVTYINAAPEPLPGTRLVRFTVFDGVFHSDPATANISLNLTNDNFLTLNCGGEGVVFQEGSPERISVTSQLTVVDLDFDHMIYGGNVNIMNPQGGDYIFLDPSLAHHLYIDPLSNTSLEISGTASDNIYQVHRITIAAPLLLVPFSPLYTGTSENTDIHLCCSRAISSSTSPLNLSH